jgi:hypothetical protein
MSDFVYGDKIGRDGYRQAGSFNTIDVANSHPAQAQDLEEAVTQLRAFIAQLVQDGVIDENGRIADSAAVVAAVESQPSRLRAVGRDAKEALLWSVVQDGVGMLILSSLGRSS